MPKLVNHEERRASIALGVIAVMSEQGISGVSLRSVAQAVGVSMGQVQHYFATKAELVRHACQLFIDRANEQHEETSDAAPRDRLERLLTMNIPGAADERAGTAIWYEFVIAGAKDVQIAEMITGAWRSRHRHLVALLPSAEAADRVAALSDGLAVRAMLGDITHAAARSCIANELADLDT